MWRITPTSLRFRNVGGTQQQREVRDCKTRSDWTTPWLSREELLPALPWLSTRSVMLVCCCCAHKWNHTMRLSHKRSSWFFLRVCASVDACCRMRRRSVTTPRRACLSGIPRMAVALATGFYLSFNTNNCTSTTTDTQTEWSHTRVSGDKMASRRGQTRETDKLT